LGNVKYHTQAENSTKKALKTTILIVVLQ